MAKILKIIGWIGLAVSALWLVEWHSIEKLDINLIGMTAYFSFSQIVLISVLSHLATIAAKKAPTLPNRQSDVLDDF